MNLVGIDRNPIPAGAVTGPIRTLDGITIRVARWPAPKGRRRGTVLVIQGRNEFIEKYFEAVSDLLKRGFAVVAFDWRGQGGSERLLPNGHCHIESYADYDRDLDAVMRQIVLPDCPPPYFALAHSMGALACLRAARDGRAPFERMVLMTPMLELSRAASPPMPVIRLITGAGLLAGLDGRAITAAPWRKWKTLEPVVDPRMERTSAVLAIRPGLRTGIPSIRWLHSAALAMKDAETAAFAAAVRIPSLMVIAGRDNVVDNAAIARLATDLRSAGHVVIPGAKHEILMEADVHREQLWAAFDAFIPGTEAPVSRLASKEAENTVV